MHKLLFKKNNFMSWSFIPATIDYINSTFTCRYVHLFPPAQDQIHVVNQQTYVSGLETGVSLVQEIQFYSLNDVMISMKLLKIIIRLYSDVFFFPKIMSLF